MAALTSASASLRAPLRLPIASASDPAPTPAPTSGAGASAGAATGATTGAPTPAPTATDGQLPPTWTDPQGRVFQQAIDTRGHLVRTHHESGPQGANTLATDITYDFSPDGTAARTVHQRLTAPGGDARDVVEVASFDATGAQVGDDVTDTSTQGGTTTVDHTVSTLDAAGQPTHRVETYEKRQHQLDAKTGETVDARQVTVGTWDSGGAPIGDDVVPAITFTERVEYTTPGAGINTDTARHLVTERSGAGTPLHLDWIGPMHLTARFDGHGSQYVERKVDYPLDAAGNPDMAHPTIVSDENHESGLNQAVMKARIYGGFASSLLGIGGINLVGLGLLKGVGKGMLWAGAAAGAAAVAAETSAFATRRNDAYWPNLAMNVYDTAWMGLYAYTRTFPPKGAAADAAAGAIDPARVVGDNAVAGAGLLGSGSTMRHATGDGALGADATATLVRARRSSGLDTGIAVPASALADWHPDAGSTTRGPRLDVR